MAGHSKWANIKHRKARVDAKRAKVWSKLASNIIQAARSGGDPDKNHRLAFTIAEARKENMPVANIERAIKRGTGEIEGADPEELLYEGYAHGGTAIIIEALTDNRKRTAPEIKFALEKRGGNLGQPGSVMHSFDRKGMIVLEAANAPSEDDLFELATEAGAEDIETVDEYITITTGATEFEPVKKALMEKEINWVSAELEYIPHARNEVDIETARKIQKLIDVLDDIHDVQAVYTNHEPPEEFMAEME